MADEILNTRASDEPYQHTGPYLAEVVDVVDTENMGRLGVRILRGWHPEIYKGEVIWAKYLNPFYGVTSLRYEGANSADFNDVQKSYGMWFVPPDPGTIVIVMFIGGNSQECYWIGCSMDQSQNFMIPGIAATSVTHLTSAQFDKYKTNLLPVAEFNKSTQDTNKNVDPEKIPRPVHPFADRLLAQGLLKDTIRGITSSSARRGRSKDSTFVNSVFGISTPGPIDKDGRKGKTGSIDNIKTPPISRLGGSTFVMDDGDENGNNELVRIRTRTGHQILMHNSQELIYIAHATGNTWIELTKNGKIDIYAADSVSIHSEADFNFRAERDINLEAGRNINISATGDWHADVGGNFIVNAGIAGILSFDSSLDIYSPGDIKVGSENDLHLSSYNLFAASTELMHLVAGSTIYQTASTDINVKASGNIIQTAAVISTNSIPAVSGTAALTPEVATNLPTQELPSTTISTGWANFYKGRNIQSIMNRVPMHEPWTQHENINPSQFTPDATDVTVRTGVGTSSRPSLTPTDDYKQAPNVQGTPPTPTGKTEDDNIAAFLWMIRVCEGTSSSKGYQIMFTGATFDPENPKFIATNKYTQRFDGQPNKAYQWKDHPNLPISASISGNGITSTAAGAYQFLYSTWKECQSALGLPDFSPLSQDKACIRILKQRKALNDIMAGNFTSAIAKTNRIWASLPGSPYNQHPKEFGIALAYFKQAGGTFVA